MKNYHIKAAKKYKTDFLRRNYANHVNIRKLKVEQRLEKDNTNRGRHLNNTLYFNGVKVTSSMWMYY